MRTFLKGSVGNYYDRIAHANGDLYKKFTPGSGWELHRDEADVAKVYQATMKGITEDIGMGYSIAMTSALGGFEAGFLENSGTRATLKTASGGTRFLLESIRMRLLRTVQNPQLRKMIEFLYRANAKFGNGSTGAMIREELKNGARTSASGSHIKKAQEALVQ